MNPPKSMPQNAGRLLLRLITVGMLSLTAVSCSDHPSNNSRSRAPVAQVSDSSIKYAFGFGPAFRKDGDYSCTQTCLWHKSTAGHTHETRPGGASGAVCTAECGLPGSAYHHWVIDVKGTCNEGNETTEYVPCNGGTPSVDTGGSNSAPPAPPTPPTSGKVVSACQKLCEYTDVLLQNDNTKIAICHSLTTLQALIPEPTWVLFNDCYRDNLDKATLPYGSPIGSYAEGSHAREDETNCIQNLQSLMCGKRGSVSLPGRLRGPR